MKNKMRERGQSIRAQIVREKLGILLVLCHNEEGCLRKLIGGSIAYLNSSLASQSNG